MRNILLMAAVMVTASTLSTSLQAGTYTTWEYDAPNKRYHCYYEYKVNNKTERQRVIWYPGCEDSRYYYFIKPTKKQYWGRCVSPWAKDFSENCMKWDMMKNGKWKPEAQCACPHAPDDPAEIPIDEVPKPPKL